MSNPYDPLSDTYELLRATLIAWKGTPKLDQSRPYYLVSMRWEDGSAAAVRQGAAFATPWAQLDFDGQVFRGTGEFPEAALMHAFVELASYAKAKAASYTSTAEQAVCRAAVMAKQEGGKAQP